MKIKGEVRLKHFASNAQDLEIEVEVDFKNRVVSIHADWVDTVLVQWFIQLHMVGFINREIEKLGNMAALDNLNRFDIELIVSGRIRFNVVLIEAELNETTLVMELKD